MSVREKEQYILDQEIKLEGLNKESIVVPKGTVIYASKIDAKGSIFPLSHHVVTIGIITPSKNVPSLDENERFLEEGWETGVPYMIWQTIKKTLIEEFHSES